MGSPVRNDFVAPPTYPLVIASSIEKGKEEDIPVANAQQPTTLKFADLPDEVLGMIFQRTIFGENNQTDLKAVDGIRNMGSRYYNILEKWVLEPLWNKLQTAISHPEEIPNPIIRASFNSTHARIFAEPCAELPAVKPRLSNTYFRAFCELHQDLKENWPIKPVNLSLGSWQYKEMHKKINNIALEAWWKHIKDRPFFQKAPFQQENVNGDQICEWLNNPQYAKDIAEGVGDRWVSHKVSLNDFIPILPVEIANCTQLKILAMVNRHIKIISDMAFDKIGRFTQLKTLQLNNNKLTRLPDTINKLIHLNYLYLGNNELTDLPHTFVQLTQLKHLGLEANKLAHFPDVISQLTQLEILFLEGNQLTTIPPTVAYLTRLQVLYLDNNRLTSIPSTMTQLAQLGISEGPEPDFNPYPLSLFGNPLVFLLDATLSLPLSSSTTREIPAQEHMAKYVACSTYPCQTPLATLCKQIHLDADISDLLQKFEELPAEIKQNIRQKLASVASTQASSSSATWNATDDLLADKTQFVEAVMAVAGETLQDLSLHEKGLVYRWVLMMARRLTPELDQQLGQAGANHIIHPIAATAAAANSIRFIEAIELVLSGQFPHTVSLEEPETNANS